LYAFQIKAVSDMTKEETEEAGIECTPFPFHTKMSHDRPNVHNSIISPQISISICSFIHFHTRYDDDMAQDGKTEDGSDRLHMKKRQKPSFERKRMMHVPSPLF
jgi:hypothetical protein